MAKQSCWFGWVKRVFVSKAKPKEAKKSRKWIWTLGRLKTKQYHAIAEPDRSLSEVTEEQRQHALNVAVATAAAAEAAVAAAKAAAEVVRLTGGSKPHHLVQKKDRNMAATVIQSAFRAYLARKALRALKGLVKLQAIVRGRAVRRQTSHLLKRFSSNAKMQSEPHKTSFPFDYGNGKDGEKKLFFRPVKELGEKETKHDCNSPRSWDSSLFSKQDMETIWLKKQEAIMKRERMKQYSFSHRERRECQMLEESPSSKEQGKKTFWLEQWAHKEGIVEGFHTPYSFPRRSFCHGKRNIVSEENTAPNSPVLPTYMGVTESARAKLRSMSAPRQRQGFIDMFSDQNFPYKHTLSFSSSYNCDSPTNTKLGASQQVLVSMKS